MPWEKSPVKRIRKFLQLSRRDQLLLIQAFSVLGVVVLGLRVLPWLTLQRRLLNLPNWYARLLFTRRPSAQHIAWAIKVASGYLPKATCLPRALAAQVLLTQCTYPAGLQIGVARNENGTLEAHAWVTSENGIIIGDVADPDRFVQLLPLGTQYVEDYGRGF